MTRGDIIHSSDICGIDHGKFFVVLGVTQTSVVGFFFINSIVNKYLENVPGQLELQLIIRPCDYNFLRHDSFVCGSSLQEIPLNELDRQQQDGTAVFVDRLRDDDMKALMDVCRKSKLYTTRQKKLYFY